MTFYYKVFFITIKKRINASKMKMLANMEFLKPCSETNGAIFLGYRDVNDCRELLSAYSHYTRECRNQGQAKTNAVYLPMIDMTPHAMRQSQI